MVNKKNDNFRIVVQYHFSVRKSEDTQTELEMGNLQKHANQKLNTIGGVVARVAIVGGVQWGR